MAERPASDNSRIIVTVWIAVSVVLTVAWRFAPDWIPAGKGDQFDGLSALFSGLAFAGLIATILLQRQDLKVQTQELAKSNEQLEAQANALNKQNFESTFFHMVQLHHGIVGAMRRNDGNGREKVGRDAIDIVFQEFRDRQHSATNHGQYKAAINQAIRANQVILGHYINNFYCMLEYVDANNVDQDLYVRIIKAQLSTIELIVLFYCTFFDTDDWIKIACKYRLFDTIDRLKLFRPDQDWQVYQSSCVV